MPAVRRALKDILAGAIFIAFGLAFALGSLAYDIGSPTNMGPGYVPLALGLVLDRPRRPHHPQGLHRGRG